MKRKVEKKREKKEGKVREKKRKKKPVNRNQVISPAESCRLVALTWRAGSWAVTGETGHCGKEKRKFMQ